MDENNGAEDLDLAQNAGNLMLEKQERKLTAKGYMVLIENLQNTWKS